MKYYLLLVVLFVTGTTISQDKSVATTTNTNATHLEKESKLAQTLKQKELALEAKYNKLKQKLDERKTKDLQKEQNQYVAKANAVAAQNVLLENEQRRLAQIRINDSIAEVNERKRIATLYKNEQQRKLALLRADSITKAKKALKYDKRLAEKKAKALEKQNSEKAIAARKKKSLEALAEARALETEALTKALEAARKEIEALKQLQIDAALVTEKTMK